MTLSEIVEMVVSNGMSVAIIAYFLFKDYKFNQTITDVMTEIKEVLASLKTWHEKGRE